MNSPPATARPRDRRRRASREPKKIPRRPARRCRGGTLQSRKAEIERESADQQRAGDRGAEHDAPARDRRRQPRARRRPRSRTARDRRSRCPRCRRSESLISGGSSDSTTMPTSQNQLVTIAPHHSRASARRWRIIAQVEAAMLAETRKCGAPSPLGGMSSADDPAGERKAHQQRAKSATSRRRRARPGRRRWCRSESRRRSRLDQRVGGGQLLARGGRAGCRI